MNDLLEAVRTRLAAGLPVRRTLPAGGRLHIDRPLPFLCVYRMPPGQPEPGADGLVRTQASHLVASGEAALHADMAALTGTAVAALTDACGACLLLELWIGSPGDEAPRIRLHTPDAEPPTTMAALAGALGDMNTPVGALPVDVIAGSRASPPGLAPLVDETQIRRHGCLPVGLEMPPVFRSPVGVYPLVLRGLVGELTRALQRGFFEFTRVQTSGRPAHYQMMGRRRLVRAVREADAALAEIGRSFDLLLDLSPVNGEEAFAEFCASKQRRAPAFRYRTLVADPELTKRRLYELPLERLEDPVLALLLREKRSELDRQLNLLEDRDSPRFLPGSLQLYGGVEDELLAEAIAILDGLPARPSLPRPTLDADAFASRARAEIEHYRLLLPALGSTVEVRDDINSVMVSNGNVLIPRRICVAEERVPALLQHEIGTHVLTGANGQAQPLRVLAAGLAGYEALQEGIALFAEHLAGGLGTDRLRVVALRVVAVRRMVEGATLPELARELRERHGLGARSAFSVALRVYRGGGLTKDAIYLRGLLQLLTYLGEGGSFDPLLVGKIAIDHVPLMEELVWRKVLRPAALRPRWLQGDEVASRLERARAGLRPLDLLSPGGSR